VSDGKRLLALIAQGQFVLSVHALERHQSRAISESDIRCCARTASKVRWQETHESWRIDGKDTDGERLAIAAVFEDEAIIVTVFRPETDTKPARRKR
jgi:Domain of unknown function (DUF4258)